jgi:dephospho-CoA kinase
VGAFRHAIVLTGSIATGKSTVARIFSSYGVASIDADRVAHHILDTQTQEIASLFGAGYVVNGKVDRKALGKTVFADVEKRQALESLLHPLIQAKITAQAKILNQLEQPYLVDMPLFFEFDRYPIKRSIVVYTTRQIQLERLIQREGYSPEEAQSRIDIQMDIEQKCSLATWVIDNNGDREHLHRECQRVWELILIENRL